MTQITNFKILGLHGYKNFNIKFKNNKLILVGENGSGKTSVLRIFYYFLTCDWSELSKFNFESLQLTINNKKLELKRDDLQVHKKKTESMLRHLPPPVRRTCQIALERGDIEKFEYTIARYMSPVKAREYFRHAYQEDMFDGQLQLGLTKNKNKLSELSKEINDLVDFTILYLPTYRRIEQELKFILKGFDEEDIKEKSIRRSIFNSHRCVKNHIELIEFGMKDVEEAKDEVLNDLKEYQRTELNRLTLRYLGDVVNKQYEKINLPKIKKATEEDIDNVLSRIDENLLNIDTKNKLRDAIQEVKSKTQKNIEDEHSKVICHYFMKLLDFQELLEEKERKMRDFCAVCNKYITDKEFNYESSLFEFSIKSKQNFKDNQNIGFHQLSSGEKQIVSLFSQLYLTDNNKYFVIIDEPELSLSVPWQKTFLVDIQSGDFCKGLFAVTHSPFIYDNELDKYAHGLGEFNK